MSRKTILMIAMLIGSSAGGYAAVLLGAHAISFASLLGSTAGAILGVWLAYRLTA